MGPLHVGGLLEGSVPVGAEDTSLRLSVSASRYECHTHRLLRNWGSPAHQLATTAQPLALGDEGHSIALLMYSQVAAITEDNGVGVLAVAVVANGTLGILFLALGCRLAVDCCSGARTGTVGLRGLRVRLRYSCLV